MPVSDYSGSPSGNTTISGINIAEGCSPANINNAIRQLMADLKNYQAAQIPFTPGEGVLAENVQDALYELAEQIIAAMPPNATPTSAGLMSGADKTKLNGIAAEATKDAGQAASVWATGTSTAEVLISAKKLQDKISARLSSFATDSGAGIAYEALGAWIRSPGGIGSFAMAMPTLFATHDFGDVVSGGDLRPAGGAANVTTGNSSGSASVVSSSYLAGSWVCLGRAGSDGSNSNVRINTATLYLRVA